MVVQAPQTKPKEDSIKFWTPRKAIPIRILTAVGAVVAVVAAVAAVGKILLGRMLEVRRRTRTSVGPDLDLEAFPSGSPQVSVVAELVEMMGAEMTAETPRILVRTTTIRARIRTTKARMIRSPPRRLPPPPPPLGTRLRPPISHLPPHRD